MHIHSSHALTWQSNQTCSKHPKTKKETGPKHYLAQLLLRPRGLAQASSLRLSEGSKSGNSSLRVLSLRRDLLAWAKWTLTQNRSYSPELQLAQASWESYC